MKAHLARGLAPSHHSRLSRSPRSLAVVLAILSTSLAASLVAPSAHAGAALFSTSEEPDPLDGFLDRALGEPPIHDAAARALTVGVDASLRLSSEGASSFGALAFVQIPFERLLTPPRRAPKSLLLAQPPPTARAAPAPATPLAASPSRAARAPSASPPVLTPRRPSAVVATPVVASPPPTTPPSRSAAPSPSAASPSSPPAARAPASAPSAAPPSPLPAAAVLPALAATSTDLGPSAPAPLLTADLARGAVGAACTAAHLDESDARLDGLAARARTSAMLPELRLRATRVIDESESLAPTEYDPTRRTASGGATTWLEARATFRLDRLVFADDEIAVERLRLARAAERTKLVAKVLELLDAWQRARSSASDEGAKPDARIRAVLAAATAEASLDVLTNGWFSKALALSSERAAGPVAEPAQQADVPDDAAHPSATAPSPLADARAKSP